MLPRTASQGVAIAMPLSTESLQQLWRMRRQTFLRRALPALGAVLGALGLGILGALHPYTANADAAQNTETVISHIQDIDIMPVDLCLSILHAGLSENVRLDPQGDYARIVEHHSVPEAYYGMTWNSRDQVDLSVSVSAGPLDFVQAARVTLSATSEMDLLVQLDADGESCADPEYDRFLMTSTVHLVEDPVTFEVPIGESPEFGQQCGDDPVIRDWTITLYPLVSTGILWVHSLEFILSEVGVTEDYRLPLCPELFSTGITRDGMPVSSGTAGISTRSGAKETSVVFDWDVKHGDHVDVSYDLAERLGAGVEALELVLVASQPMAVRLEAAWEVDDCPGYRFIILEADCVLDVTTEEQTFVVPYSSFRQLVPRECPQSGATPALDRLVCLTLHPETLSGKLEFLGIRLLASSSSY
jgi:hypothetical protein